MTFDVLEKTPEVAPLLVRLYDTHNLYALAGNKNNDDACAELTGVMVDLLNIRLSDRESELITDVLLALMKQAEADLKAALAERIACLDHVPLRIILGLANDEIKVADPILRNSPLLQDLDLIYILQAKGVGHGRSIAKRPGLSGDVIDMLADTRDFDTVVNLSANKQISLTPHAYEIFSEMAKESELLARPLLSRKDLPQDVAGRLYEFVSSELKKILSERYGIGGTSAIAALDEISSEFSDVRPATERIEDETSQLIAYAHNQHRRGELKFSSLMSTLRRGQLPTFIAQFAVFFGLPVFVAKEILKQDSCKSLATACKALDVPKADFVNLYLLCERFRSNTKKVINHKDLSRIMSIYEEIDAVKARRILRNSRN